jgi:hypothetical protein
LLLEVPQKLQEEANAEHARILSKVEKETVHGSDVEQIDKWETRTRNELDRLSDYCKTCKPKKKK